MFLYYVMTLCINPNCSKPRNLDHHSYCENCGSKLLLKGSYRALKKLAEGGFGVTYIVRDNSKNIDKVLKILTLDKPDALRLFKQDAEILTQLNHVGIPKVEDDGYFEFFARDSKEPIHCLIMEKIEGDNLETWLEKSGKLSDQQKALRWLIELTDILNSVHKKGFVHRDVNLSNIILKPDGKLALIDFGTAKKYTKTYIIKAKLGESKTVIIKKEGYRPTEQENGFPVPQ